MLTWLLALLCGAAAAFLSYGARAAARPTQRWIAFGLRAVAITFLAGALLNAPLGFRGAPPSLVLLDASASWLRAGDTAAWRVAVTEAHRRARDSVVLFGDTVRAANAPAAPVDPSSRLHPALLRALGSGRAITLITDGEIDDPASILDALPAGSNVIVPERAARTDAAVLSVDVPRYVTSGDSLSVRVALVAGPAGSRGGNVAVLAQDRLLASAPLDSAPPYGEQVVVLPAYWGGREEGSVLLRTVLTVAGDAEPRNDTLTAAVEASATPGVVFVSTAPDLDARYALAVLRGALALPTRAFMRVAPGNWRLEGPLTRVEESEVRRSVSQAPVVILHGDTAIFGSPRELTRGALLLFSTSTQGGDWYPVAAPPSPVASALSGIPWDSLPPIATSGNVPRGEWAALETRRARQFESRIAISGTAGQRRIGVVGASGLWRWAFKGGVSADAYSALWGGIFDWLVAERSDEREATPAAQYFRAGEPIRWKRGTRADSSVTVAITPRRPGGVADTLLLAFAGAATVESRSLPAGVYDVAARGGNSLLVVNESRELVPRHAVVRGGAVEGVPAANERRGTRRTPAVYVLIVAALCAEWLLRRRMGLR